MQSNMLTPRESSKLKMTKKYVQILSIIHNQENIINLILEESCLLLLLLFFQDYICITFLDQFLFTVLWH